MIRILIVLLFFGVSLSAEEKAAYQGTAQVTFFATSTFHDFSGTGSTKPFDVYPSTEKNGYDWRTELVIEQLDTQKPKLNKAMYRMFDTKAFPLIIGSFKEIAFSDAQISFDLTIRNTTKKMLAHMRRVEVHENSITFELEFDVSLKDFDLKPPTFLGFIKVGDLVKVNNHFTINKT